MKEPCLVVLSSAVLSILEVSVESLFFSFAGNTKVGGTHVAWAQGGRARTQTALCGREVRPSPGC